jgi:hypothetical protein
MKSLAVALALLSLASLFAGCSATKKDISISGPDAQGNYTFSTGVGADQYVWDLGDHLTTMTGKSVTHKYDITNGVITVLLKAKSGSDVTEYRQELTLGTGINAKPTFTFQAMTEWAVTGEQMVFSAQQSTDPDGDALRYTWQCFAREIYRVVPHNDALPPSTVTQSETSIHATFANTTLAAMPPATLTLTGDFCDAMNNATWPREDATTIQGNFSKPGYYQVTLIASDGPHSTVSGFVGVYVSVPGERPGPKHHEEFEGTFLVGTPESSGQSAQPFCDGVDAIPGPCDEIDYPFDLKLNLLGGWVNATLGTAPVAGTEGQLVYTYELLNGGALIIANGKLGDTYFPQKPTTTYGTYHLKLYAEQGAQIPYKISFDGFVNLNPRTVYELKPLK